MTPVWVRELADAYWRTAEPEGYPRALGGMSLALRLTEVPVRGLTLAAVRDWMERRNVRLSRPRTRPGPPRLSVSHRGQGIVFLDPADDPAEVRFTRAHEIAHYLRDVWQVRERIVAKLGPGILDVLDGRRPPTVDEIVSALLRNVPAGPVVHLLGRGPDETPEGRAAEEAADRLAFELLAPADEVRSPDELVERFGLPVGKAAEYAEILRPAEGKSRLMDIVFREPGA